MMRDRAPDRSSGETLVNIARKNQRADDRRMLEEVRASLPTGSLELPGIIRAIELLTYEPLRYGG